MKKRFQTKHAKKSTKKKSKYFRYKRTRKNIIGGKIAGKTHNKTVNYKLTPYYIDKHITIEPIEKNKESIEWTDWEKVNEDILNFDSKQKHDVFKDHFNKSNVDEKIIYGKFWMEGCGFCIAIKNIWKDLVNEIRNDHPTQLYDADFRQENIDEAKRVLKEITNVKDIPINGYPTIYLIKNEKVYIYDNDRTLKAMKEWILSFL
jgi:thiol-disulfide isomerase/thioredoxin